MAVFIQSSPCKAVPEGSYPRTPPRGLLLARIMKHSTRPHSVMVSARVCVAAVTLRPLTWSFCLFIYISHSLTFPPAPATIRTY